MSASIIIVNFNGGDQVLRCIASVLHNSGDDYEVIVVDNASTDNSADRIEAEYAVVKLIRSTVNDGFGEGNNVGAKYAKGEYLAFLNPDTLVEPGWLDAMIVALKRHPEAGLATSRIVMMDNPDEINTCGNTVHYTGLTLCRGLGRPREAYDMLDTVNAISGAAFVIHRDLFQHLGGFDGLFFLYMEDTDLSWRASLSNYTTLFVPDSIVHHDYTLRFSRLKTFYQERNRYLMLLKSLRWRSLLVLLPALLLTEVITWGFVLMREQGRRLNKLRAYAWVLKNWRSIMENRRRTQTLRRVLDRQLIEHCAYQIDYGQVGQGISILLARTLSNPLFGIYQRAALALIRW
jgi:GT2 family glycosyltransferase